MLSLYVDQSDIDFLTQAGREPAICELFCPKCSEGMKYDQLQCATCGELNPRYLTPPVEFDPARPIAAKSIP